MKRSLQEGGTKSAIVQNRVEKVSCRLNMVDRVQVGTSASTHQGDLGFEQSDIIPALGGPVPKRTGEGKKRGKKGEKRPLKPFKQARIKLLVSGMLSNVTRPSFKANPITRS